jgi:hypothetical protein
LYGYPSYNNARFVTASVHQLSTTFQKTMRAPTASELLKDALVQQALEQAWLDSLPTEPDHRHEEGGWIYLDANTGAIAIQRAPAGGRADLDLTEPEEIPGSFVVATFHTHPNPSADGWDPQPSPADTQSAWLLGVPCLIKADDGIYTTGPNSRRGGLVGRPGFPD